MNGFHMFPERVTPHQLERVMLEIASRPHRRTPLSRRNRTVWWDEIEVPGDPETAGLLLSGGIRTGLAAEFPPIQDAVFWANRYGPGEYIPRHKDRAGDLQLLLVVKVPADEEAGGTLSLHFRGNPVPIPQNPGQILVFRASRTPHETSKLVPTNACPNPVRIACIGRLFLRFKAPSSVEA